MDTRPSLPRGGRLLAAAHLPLLKSLCVHTRPRGRGLPAAPRAAASVHVSGGGGARLCPLSGQGAGLSSARFTGGRAEAPRRWPRRRHLAGPLGVGGLKRPVPAPRVRVAGHFPLVKPRGRGHVTQEHQAGVRVTVLSQTARNRPRPDSAGVQCAPKQTGPNHCGQDDRVLPTEGPREGREVAQPA